MKTTILAAGIAASLIAAPALAQTTTTTVDPAVTTTDTATMTQPVEEDNEFPWGLLGLLGLAGLLGRKRDDRVHHTDTTRTN